MFRFSMEGKPWTLVFWWRYKVFTGDKFKMNVGAHPAYVFRSIKASSNGVTSEYLTAQRYFAWEATPTYFFNRNFGLGVYYLGSHGLDENITQYTHFVALKSILSNIKISNQFRLTFIPQIYYLTQDGTYGTYTSSIISIKKENFPLALSSIVSKKIKSDIAGKDLIWNIQLTYNFNNSYYKITNMMP